MEKIKLDITKGWNGKYTLKIGRRGNVRTYSNLTEKQIDRLQNVPHITKRVLIGTMGWCALWKIGAVENA